MSINNWWKFTSCLPMSKNRSRTSARPLEMEVKPWNEDTKGKELLDRECRRTWCVWRVKTLAGGTGRALGAWAGASVSRAGSPSLGSPSPPPAPLRVGIGRRSNRHASDKAEQWRPRGRREKKIWMQRQWLMSLNNEIPMETSHSWRHESTWDEHIC